MPEKLFELAHLETRKPPIGVRLYAATLYFRPDGLSRGRPRGGKVSKNLFWSNEKAFGRFSESLNRTVEAAIFYVTKNGIVWRDLPEGFPTWQTVYRSGAPVVLPKVV